MRVSYRPGATTLLVRGRRLCHVQAPLEPGVTDALWRALDHEGGDGVAARLTDLVLAHHAAGVAPALVVLDGDRLVTRGGPAVSVDGHALSTTDLQRVSTRALAPGSTVDASGGAIDYPICSGVVLASAWTALTGAGDAVALAPSGTATRSWQGEPEPPEEPRSHPAEPPAARPGTGGTATETILTPPTPPGTGTVLAAMCPIGHPSPAHSTSCRVCGRRLRPQTPTWIGRPILGRLVLPGGQTLELDRGAVFGRAPRRPADVEAEPYLVDISAHGPHLSRMHLEVVIDGWFVLVRDLGSTEGSTIVRPGGPAQRLTPQELVPLTSGTVVDLAGDYAFTFEVT